MTSLLTRVPESWRADPKMSCEAEADFEAVQERLWDIAAELSALGAEDLVSGKPWLAAHDAELEAVQQRLRDLAAELGTLARPGGS